MTDAARLYLDTNTLIFATEEMSERSKMLNALLDASICRPKSFLVTSELALAELLVKPLRVGNDDLVKRYTMLIRTGEWLDVYPVGRPVLLQAGELRAHSRLKLPDAIHLATAQLSGCTHFITADTDFAGVSNRPFDALAIVRPDIPTLTALLESLAS